MMISAFTESNVRPATVRDVARLAGVSAATLSRVVNGADNVSGERRTKVLTAVSELQYCPNLYAAELGRANRNIPKQLGIHVPVLARHKGKRQF
jgi:LacI family transcriptional regulator